MHKMCKTFAQWPESKSKITCFPIFPTNFAKSFATLTLIRDLEDDEEEEGQAMPGGFQKPGKLSFSSDTGKSSKLFFATRAANL